MQIYVCVKHVPDSAANITVIDDIRIDPNLAFLLNPYDEHALTEAVKIRDEIPGSEVIAVCLGPDDAEKTKCVIDLMKSVDEYIPDPQRDLDKPFSMAVEDVFSISGRGTVATGRI